MDFLAKSIAGLKKIMRFWMRAFIFGIWIGIVWLGFYLYTIRPIPWNEEAITADFDRISTNSKDYITFNYVLRNNTGKDYSLDKYGSKTFITRLDGSLSQSDDIFDPETSVYIPANEAAYITLTMPYPYPGKSIDFLTATDKEIASFREEVAQYLEDRLSNLDGFLLLDENSRYKIKLAPGWKSPAELAS